MNILQGDKTLGDIRVCRGSRLSGTAPPVDENINILQGEETLGIFTFVGASRVCNYRYNHVDILQGEEIQGKEPNRQLFDPV